ncbi:DNA polymerase III subunit alpha [bacterium]|nr:DNA polymerase III subunit alpha [bacterium]
MPQRDFVHLHLHTEYSLLDGSIKVDKLADQAHRFKMPAVAITDHGNLFGVVPFYKAMQKKGIKPIIGLETYVASGKLTEKGDTPASGETSHHLTLIASSNIGYKNLVKLSSAAYLEGFYYRPRIDKTILAEHNEGLIALSGCWSGEISSCLIRGDIEGARKALGFFLDLFGRDNFFIEIQNLGMPETHDMISRAVSLAKEEKANLVATNDCHFLNREDAEAHDVLLAIQTGKKVADTERMRFESSEMYFKSADEMSLLFKDIPEALENTQKIAERCMVTLDVDGRNFKLPRYPIPKEFSSSMQYLKDIAERGCREKNLWGEKSYEQRLAHELKVIEKMGFAGYFLIVKDIVDFAKRTGIPVGPGRGSAVGSLVLYALGITELDPLHYGLIFERFLNPDRITLPDIDIDFADDEREKVIHYIHERYGQENVARIITFDTMKAKAAIRDVGRAMDIPLGEVDKIAKLIPMNDSLEQARKSQKELAELIESDIRYQRLFKIAEKLEGVSRHASIHASGVVITPEPLTEFIPLYRASDGGVSTQFDMKAIDSMGILKLDILGLRTLSVIKMSERIVKERGGSLNCARIPFDDKKTFELLQRAETAGIFQLESRGMRDILRRLMPTSIEDISAVIAIYRPGPLGNIDIDDFCRRKNGQSEIKYLHPNLEPVLASTYGMFVYQEQVMQTARAIAGFSYVQADHLRRAMGKKIPELMAQMKEQFFEGAFKHGVDKKTTQEIYDQIEPFSGYGFNKSHSAGYAHISYATAYLKANFPLEFFTSLLTNEMGHSEAKMSQFITDAKQYGINILRPDINKSSYSFKIEDTSIRFGLGAVKNVGKGAAELIESENSKRHFKDFRDFLERTKGSVNRKCVEYLIKAGCFDSMDPNRELLLAHLIDEMARLNDKRGLLMEKQAGLFSSESAEKQQKQPVKSKEFKPSDFLNYEKDAFGFYLSGHPMEEYRDIYEGLDLTPIEEIDDNSDGKNLAVGGTVSARKAKRDKKGNEYSIITLRDFTGEIDVFVFARLYEQHRDILRTDEPIIFKGRASASEDDARPKLFSEEIIPFSGARARIKSVIVDLDEKTTREDLIVIKSLLSEFPGRCSVYLNVYTDKTGEKTKVLCRDSKVSPSPELIENLRRKPGVRKVKLHGTL